MIKKFSELPGENTSKQLWGSNSDNLKTAFTQLRQVSQNNHKTPFERCAGNTVSHGERIQGSPDETNFTSVA